MGVDQRAVRFCAWDVHWRRRFVALTVVMVCPILGRAFCSGSKVSLRGVVGGEIRQKARAAGCGIRGPVIATPCRLTGVPMLTATRHVGGEQMARMTGTTAQRFCDVAALR